MMHILVFKTNPACFPSLVGLLPERYMVLSLAIKAGCNMGYESGQTIVYCASESSVCSICRHYHYPTPLEYDQVVRRQDNALHF